MNFCYGKTLDKNCTLPVVTLRHDADRNITQSVHRFGISLVQANSQFGCIVHKLCNTTSHPEFCIHQSKRCECSRRTSRIDMLQPMQNYFQPDLAQLRTSKFLIWGWHEHFGDLWLAQKHAIFLYLTARLHQFTVSGRSFQS